ncbi:hypothetical protein P170DRAFT_257967 [Aspergillus steynii IBT 23096]|uniref:Uncharacterized protein n=1 Tax=Aspergillus steynii IBT 23096 TaxID=1392250 RepID=A0A2I2FZD5_9EURO|nr:uncharacterized protein P170DRAFT_257967 [Aspergillus steynii IBT 23096]PLB45988.1 hypothetical protein P170DRAFT_257967 [Aspergillus steynii IBT 23096]
MKERALDSLRRFRRLGWPWMEEERRSAPRSATILILASPSTLNTATRSENNFQFDRPQSHSLCSQASVPHSDPESTGWLVRPGDEGMLNVLEIFPPSSRGWTKHHRRGKVKAPPKKNFVIKTFFPSAFFLLGCLAAWLDIITFIGPEATHN